MGKFEEKCIFCNIAIGKIPAKKVYEDEKIVGFLDINPANPGHILLIPKEHFIMLPLVPDEILGRMFAIAKKISLIMFKLLGSKGTSFFVANGAAAGQKAPHAILHIIPRYDDDGLNLSPKTVKIDDDTLSKLKSLIAVSLAEQVDTTYVVATKSVEEKKLARAEVNVNKSSASVPDENEKEYKTTKAEAEDTTTEKETKPKSLDDIAS